MNHREHAFLALTLYAALGACGSIAPGNRRGTWRVPAKSAVVGLVGAGLGVDREHCAELQDRLWYAARMDFAGEVLEDYHTVETIRTGMMKPGEIRAQGLARGATFTTVSSREWLGHPFFTVLLWTQHEHDTVLDEITRAMRRPRHMLYLGRAAGVLSLRPRPELILARDAVRALEQRVPDELEAEVLKALGAGHGQARMVFDAEAPHVPPSSAVGWRRDRIKARRTWQFEPRREGTAWVKAALENCA